MTITRTIITFLMFTALTACGGDNDSSVGSDPAPIPGPDPVTGFGETSNWSATVPQAGQSICYDFDARVQSADCSASGWDIKLTGGSRSANVFTNSGPSGPGQGGAYGNPFDRSWQELQAWPNAQTDPAGAAVPDQLYFPDAAKSVFTGDNGIESAAFEYALAGGDDRRLYPTYRVFLITTDSSSADSKGSATAPVFALQVTGYYGGDTGSVSGFVSFQWIDRQMPGSLRSATVDATSGPAYFNLVTGTETAASGDWHIAFDRYVGQLNGGQSGGGTMAGYVGSTPDGFYNLDGEPVLAAFESASPVTMADQLLAEQAVPGSARQWVQDGIKSNLQPDFQGSFPAPLDFGFYTYYPSAESAEQAGLLPVAHQLAANSARGQLVRSGEGSSYARMRLTKIEYADPADSSSQQTWTFEFEVQPPSAGQ